MSFRLILMFATVIITCAVSEENIAAIYPGDYIIGVLLPIHRQPRKGSFRNDITCGEIWEQYGIQRMEVVFQTLDTINNDPTILNYITLGVEARDSCWYPPVALRQTVEIIRESLTTGFSSSCYHKGTNQTHLSNTLIGVVGPGSSSVALQVQNLLQLFHIPQIGYSTTSKDLSDKSRFNYFLRVVPSDSYQAQVILDILIHYNWTYVSAVNTDENYGQSGIKSFRELAENSQVCIAKEGAVLSNAAEKDFENIILHLLEDPKANVVVCFCEGMTVKGLLEATRRLNQTGRFLFVGSDGWADRNDVVKDNEEQAHGSISIRIHTPAVNSFDSYYWSLKPDTNKRNPWFKEFWEMRFNCTYDHLTRNVSTRKNQTFCSGDEDLSVNYNRDPKLSFVQKSIYTFAHGLHNMHQDICGHGSKEICSGLKPFNGSLFKNYLMNVSFPYEDDDIVEFDQYGDPPGRYDIINFKRFKNGSYGYTQVGLWNNGTLTFNDTLQFAYGKTYIKSVCSEPCQFGEYKHVQQGGKRRNCCWSCIQCDEYEILIPDDEENNSFMGCKKCDKGSVPDVTKTRCQPVEIEFIKWTDIEAVIPILFSFLGITTASTTLFIYIRYNNTPIIKSSTRELCYFILVGMCIAHISVFAILAPASVASCAITRLVPGISFGLIYSSVFTKTNRIARILAGSKKKIPTKRRKCMSAIDQVIMASVLTSIEIVIAAGMLLYQPPFPTLRHPIHERAILVCNTTVEGIAIPLAYNFILIAMCTIYAFKTRNVPENFNEAKHIGFSMYTTCVIWIAFVPIYFGSESKIITLCLSVSLSALVTWIFLFLPKLYIILVHPERNVRSSFTTTKNLRCHYGPQVSSLKTEPSSCLENSIAQMDRSCQTGLDLIKIFLQECYSFQQLDPKLLISTVNDKKTKARSKSVILEEPLPNHFFPEEEGCQFRNITIKLGSATSLRSSDL